MPDITLELLVSEYLQHLTERSVSKATLYTYGKDCEQILLYFGPDKLVKNMLPVHISGFYKSDQLNKIAKSQKDRAPQTIKKTKRVLKMMLQFAVESQYIESFHLPSTKSQ